MKHFFGLRALCFFGLAATMLALPAQAAPPTIVIGVKSIDELLDDADFIGQAVGQQGIRANAEAAINGGTGGKGMAGIDQQKPLGLYWNASAPGADNVGNINFVAFLPISDVEEFQALVKMFVPDFKDDDGHWTMTAGSMALYAKMQDDYCFVSPVIESLESLPDPQKLVNPKYDIAIEVNLDAIPQEVKNAFLKATEEGGRQKIAEGPEPKNDAEAAGQQLGFEGSLAAIQSITNDGDRVTLGLDINSETRLVTIDFGLTSKPKTGLSKAMSAYSKTTPAYAAVGPDDAALRLVLSHPVSILADSSKQVFDAVRKSAESEIDNDEKLTTDAEKKAVKNVATRLFNILQSTVNSGSLHAVLVLDDGDNDTARIVTGVKLAKGEDPGKLLDDIVKLAKEKPDYAELKMDVAKHAGARIHSIDPSDDKKGLQMFGDGPIYLATRNDSIWLAMGGGSLESLKSALDQSTKKASKTDVPISLRVKPASLVTLLEQDDKELIQRAEALVGEPGDVLNFEIAPTEHDGIQLHVVFGIDLFKLGGDK